MGSKNPLWCHAIVRAWCEWMTWIPKSYTQTHTHTYRERDTLIHTHSLANICTFVMLRPWLLGVLAVQTGVQNNWQIFYSCRTFCCFHFAYNFALMYLFVFFRAESAMEGACCPFTILSTIMLGTSTHLSATSLTLYNIIIIVDFFVVSWDYADCLASIRHEFDGVFRAYQQPKPSIMQQVLEACSLAYRLALPGGVVCPNELFRVIKSSASNRIKLVHKYNMCST